MTEPSPPGSKAIRRIRYATGDFLNPGQREPWDQSEDNPMSPNFVPVGEPDRKGLDPLHGKHVRSEQARARWWALHAKKGRNPVSGEFDA